MYLSKKYFKNNNDNYNIYLCNDILYSFTCLFNSPKAKYKLSTNNETDKNSLCTNRRHFTTTCIIKTIIVQLVQSR
jgi:hypothetical protein